VGDAVLDMRRIIAYEDFLGGGSTDGIIGTLGWIKSTGAFSLEASENNHPGVVSMASGAVSGNVGNFCLTQWDISDVLNVGGIIKSAASSTLQFRFGLMATPGGTGISSEGIYFSFRGNVSTYLYVVIRNGSTYTEQSTGIQPTNGTWYRLEIKLDGTDWKFYVDGVLVVTIAVSSVPLSGLYYPSFAVATATSAARTLTVDAFGIQSAGNFR
jgi:hypothetical protein